MKKLLLYASFFALTGQVISIALAVTPLAQNQLVRRPIYPAASSFLPSDLPSLQVWYEAENISPQTDGTAVGTWPNSSGTGSGFDAIQATSGNKPTLKTAIKNGKPIVRFNGTSSTMSTSGAVTLANASTGEMSVYLVLNDTTANPGAGISAHWLRGDDGGGFTLFGLSRYNAATTGSFRGYNTAATSFLATETVANGSWVVLSAVRSAGGVQLWVSGTSTNGFVASSGTIQTASRPLKLGSNGFGSEFTACDMGDVLIYAAAHNTTDRQSVQNYLKTKFAIP